jgi:hypothetical protein
MSRMGSHGPFGHLNHKLWPNWQFDSRPLKVRNRPNFFAYNWLTTYSWKALNEGYNFTSVLISIGGLHTKLWGPKIAGLPLGNPETKFHLDVGLVERHTLYYKGGRWWLPPSLGCGESCESKFVRGSS